MNKASKRLAIILLSIVGLPAIFGGWMLMSDPSGESIGLTAQLLQLSPFNDYFIPGSILFFIIGLGSLMVIPMVVKGTPRATSCLVLAGLALCFWITVQMIMILEVNWLNSIYLLLGIGLLWLGARAEKPAIKN
jgi:hypothetical protein